MKFRAWVKTQMKKLYCAVATKYTCGYRGWNKKTYACSRAGIASFFYVRAVDTAGRQCPKIKART